MEPVVVIISSNTNITAIDGPDTKIVTRFTKFGQPEIVEKTHANGKAYKASSTEIKLELKKPDGTDLDLEAEIKKEKIKISEKSINKEVKK